MPQFVMPRTTPFEAKMREPVVRAILQEVRRSDKRGERVMSIYEAWGGVDGDGTGYVLFDF